MTATDTMQHRNSQTSVVARRRADGTLKPFIGELQHWNGKAARLRGLAASFYGTPEERNLARLEAGALLAEIRRRHSEFRTAIKGEPDHSRLLDVDAAFRRMIDQLEAVSRSGGNAGR
ncbi:hypothetical protein VW23_006465 [Devosia insulae DS-56]|uniref:Uncharacterized protein n=1 Tax=Devosia insulae DS-56 TaxID=1116389 RepID=A0A1E5XHG9_9HYPH|nr:hypothetical protein [Devosia insulae]OEO28035.1 hypothetical protein VW23_006465 [Devosia insulae DS-56]